MTSVKTAVKTAATATSNVTVTDASKPVEIPVAEILRAGDKLQLPENWTYKQAITFLQHAEKADEQKYEVVRTFDGYIWDAALAFTRALEERYGYADAVTKMVQTLFGNKEVKPTMVQLETGPGVFQAICFGTFEMPGTEGGTAEMEVTRDGRLRVEITLKRKYQRWAEDLFLLTDKLLRERSIYRGKAFKVKFDEGTTAMPSFIHLDQIDPTSLILPKDLERAIDANIWTLLRHVDDQTLPFRRGVLFAGTYGVGKTLAATVTAKIASENQVTYIYCQAKAMKEALMFARQYEPAVVFAEDIDRVMAERDDWANEILNTLDGIDNKQSKVMVIMTTNKVDSLIEAVLRPGRIDTVLVFTPPDAEAAERLIRQYGRGQIAPEVNVAMAAQSLSGQIPAVIRECVERARLFALSRGQRGHLLEDDLTASAHSVIAQVNFLRGLHEKEEEPTPEEKVGQSMSGLVLHTLSNSGRDTMKELVKESIGEYNDEN